MFYGADERRTACAELGYWRWRFLTDARGLQRIGPVAHTLFRVAAGGRTVDLRRGAFSRDEASWGDPSSYAATQAFTRVAREARIEIVRYRSVRDPEKAGCTALLTPGAFAAARPLSEQTWFLTVTTGASAWQRDGERFEFRWPGAGGSATGSSAPRPG